MKKQRKIFQIQEQDKTLETNCNGMEISKLPDKKFKVIVIEMLTKLRRRMNEHSEVFNKKRENIRKYQIQVTELKNTITEMKNTLEGFNSRLDEAEERIH